MTTVNYNNPEEAKKIMNGRSILADRDDYNSDEDFNFAVEQWKKQRGSAVEVVTIIGDMDDDEVKVSVIGPKVNHNEESDYADEYVFS